MQILSSKVSNQGQSSTEESRGNSQTEEERHLLPCESASPHPRAAR
jgi:hypothetical protein